jgi:hypothetical protein
MLIVFFFFFNFYLSLEIETVCLVSERLTYLDFRVTYLTYLFIFGPGNKQISTFMFLSSPSPSSSSFLSVLEVTSGP